MQGVDCLENYKIIMFANCIIIEDERIVAWFQSYDWKYYLIDITDSYDIDKKRIVTILFESKIRVKFSQSLVSYEKVCTFTLIALNNVSVMILITDEFLLVAIVDISYTCSNIIYEKDIFVI